MKKLILLLCISMCFISASFKQTADCNSIQDKALYSYSTLNDYLVLKLDSKTKTYTRSKYDGGMLSGQPEKGNYSITGFKITMNGSDAKVKMCGSTTFIFIGIASGKIVYYTTCPLK